MATLNTLNDIEHILDTEKKTTSNIAILYNAKLYQRDSFLNYTQNHEIECLFLDHDILSFIEFKDFHDVDILYLCLGEWKELHLGILKMIKALNENVKIVLVVDNAKDISCSTIFEFSIQGLLNTDTFLQSSYTLNQMIIDDLFIFDKQFNLKLRNLEIKAHQKDEPFKEKNNYYQLKTKEHTVLQLLAEGKSYEEIADGIDRSIDSVRYYIKSLYKKLNVTNKGAAIRIYLKE